MNDQDRITIRVSHITTIEFYRGKPRTYIIKPADLPRLHHIFNSRPWPVDIQIWLNGKVTMEFIVGDREKPDPRPELQTCRVVLSDESDYKETMDDFMMSTRS